MKPTLESEDRSTTRPWIKGIGVVLIVIVWLPVLYCVGGLGWASLQARRASASAERARATVRVGTALSDAVFSSSEAVGAQSALQCYEATCSGSPEILLANRRVNWFSVRAADGSAASFKTVEEWRRELPRLDRVGCKRVKITFCGRPWMTFLVEMDESQRVSKVGPLSVSAD